jgi:hypothetical protein
MISVEDVTLKSFNDSISAMAASISDFPDSGASIFQTNALCMLVASREAYKKTAPAAGTAEADAKINLSISDYLKIITLSRGDTIITPDGEGKAEFVSPLTKSVRVAFPDGRNRLYQVKDIMKVTEVIR